jgi:hypothetical protein
MEQLLRMVLAICADPKAVSKVEGRIEVGGNKFLYKVYAVGAIVRIDLTPEV